MKGLLEKVFSDITGPEIVQTIQGGSYTLNFIDDCSDKVCVYVLKWKDEAFRHFQEWKACIEKETSHKVKKFQTENGGEYTTKDF